jgi:hypothetical protein
VTRSGSAAPQADSVTPQQADSAASLFADQFETDSIHTLKLDLLPGSSYLACVTNIRFGHVECKVREYIAYKVANY